MKEKLSDEIRDIIAQVKQWIGCEAEYAKLTLAEKLTIFLGTIGLAAILFLLVMIALIIFSLCLVGVFAPLVGTTLAYLCTGGVFLVLAIIVALLRKQLIFNPLARMLTKLLINKEA